VQESRADIDLAATVTAGGKPVTARQVRRWRQEDVLPPTSVVRGGRGRNVASYPEGTAEIALGMALALDDAGQDGLGRWLLAHRATLIAFARGVAVREEGARSAYGKVFAGLVERIKVAPVTEGDRIAINLLRVALGEQLSFDGPGVLAEATGIEGLLRSAGGLVQPSDDPSATAVAVPWVHKMLETCSFAHLAGTVADAPWVELVATRDVLLMIRDGEIPGAAEAFPGLAEVIASDLRLALTVPQVLPLCRQWAAAST
jgi:hypothetical protein